MTADEQDDAIRRRARELADSAPPMSDETRQRLRALLRKLPRSQRLPDAS